MLDPLAGRANIRVCTLDARTNAEPLEANSTVYYYLKMLVGTNAGKWYVNPDDGHSDGQWVDTETPCGLLTLEGRAHWSIEVASPAWELASEYLGYAVDSLDRDVPVCATFSCDQSISSLPQSEITITENTLDVDGNPLGAVVDELGSPLIGAKILITYDSDPRFVASPIPYSTVSDGDGGFSVTVCVGATYRIKPVHPEIQDLPENVKRFTV